MRAWNSISTATPTNWSKTGFLEPTGCNTNPKGQNRLWRVTRACFPEIEFLTRGLPEKFKKVQKSGIFCNRLAPHEQEIQKSQKNLDFFVIDLRPTSERMKTLIFMRGETRPRRGFQDQRASIQTRRGKTDYGELQKHGFTESMLWDEKHPLSLG